MALSANAAHRHQASMEAAGHLLTVGGHPADLESPVGGGSGGRWPVVPARLPAGLEGVAQGMGAPVTGVRPPVLRSLVLSNSSVSNGARRHVAVACSLVAWGLSIPEDRRESARSVLGSGLVGRARRRPGPSCQDSQRGLVELLFPAGCGENVASF